MISSNREAAEAVAKAFRQSRAAILKLATETAGLPGLSFRERGQMRALAGLAALQFHRIVGDADATDIRNLADDLASIQRPVDQLIAAFGTEASSHRYDVELEVFGRVLENASEKPVAHLCRLADDIARGE